MRVYPTQTVDGEFESLGNAGHTGTLNDRQYSFLVDWGLTGALSDMLYAWRTARFDSYSVEGFAPNLIADFAEEKYKKDGETLPVTFSELCTHSRASNATMVDSDGVLKWAPHNLLTYSEDFSNAAWTKGGTTVAANGAAAPDNTATADEVIGSSGVGEKRIYDTNLVPSTVGITYSASVYAKANGANWLVIRDDFSGYGDTSFDLINGVIGTVASGRTATISEAANGFYLCTITVSVSASYVAGQLMLCLADTDNGRATFSGDGVKSIYLWGAHLYRSDLGGMVNNQDRGDSYVPTTSAAVYMPRVGHHIWDGSAWVNEGLLIESEARTNLYLDSETIETQVVPVTDGSDYTVSFMAGSSVVDLDESIAKTATDVFVYDTKNDSDGGAWRANTSDIGSELVTNGTFDADLTGWTTGGSDGASASVVGAAARLNGNSYIYQTISGLTAGQPLMLTVDITDTNTQGSLRVGTSVNVGDLYDSPTQTSATTLTTIVVPSGTAIIVTLKVEDSPGTTSAYMDFDNISVKEVSHSWYWEELNTATRGSRQSFPEVAVIVAETNSVTIYDGDDPDLPMWMVFGLGSGSLLSSFNSVSMRNGIMCAGSTASINFAGLLVARFLNDDAIGVRGLSYWNSHRSVSSISTRNGTWQQAGARGFLAEDSSSVLVNPSVNDVAMTVLDDAPTDGDTGLPLPTIAVATDDGVSVIKDDRTVVDWTPTGDGTVENIHIDADGITTSTGGGIAWKFFFLDEIPTSDTSAAPDFTFNQTSIPARMGQDTSAGAAPVVKTPTVFALPSPSSSGQKGLNLLSVDRNMVNHTTSDYTTGWMNGDIKGAFLADTDDTDLVGGELVTNGTFDSDTDWTKGTGWTIGSGVANSAGSNNLATLSQFFSGTVGKVYVVQYDVSNYVSGSVRTRFSGAGTSDGQLVTANGTYTDYLIYDAAYNSFQFLTLGGTGFDGSIDNISVKLADEDRSVNANGLTVNGTVTRTAVETGADLVAYSGFGSSNYLEQPYNSDLDFGTGDFCVMGWFNPSGGSFPYIFGRGTAQNSDEFSLHLDSDGHLNLRIVDSSGQVSGTQSVSDNVWSHFVVLRVSGVAYIYVNGQAGVSEANTQSVASGLSSFRIGKLAWGSAFSGSLALLRISATAPTADQISKIYEDEKLLFQPSAQATLYGSSDAVTALAHDPETDLLHVGTSAGRSVFKGLRRINNTTTAVTTAISAVDGLIGEQ